MSETETATHLVLLVHGINTRALWMYEVKPALERANFSVGHTSYGPFSILRFLSPLRSARRKAMDRVVTDIRTAIESHKLSTGRYPEKMSVISHSFGTYVVSRILLDVPDLQWYRIIFCGSVVREDFPIQQVLRSFHHPLLNEIGSRDYLPALAESAGWGYGSVGSTGFNRPPVETRWHTGFRHSDFLTDKFCTDYWVPFLNGAKPTKGDRASPLPFWIRLLTWLPIRWVIVGLASIIPILLLLGGLVVWRETVLNERAAERARIDYFRRMMTPEPQRPSSPTGPAKEPTPEKMPQEATPGKPGVLPFPSGGSFGNPSKTPPVATPSPSTKQNPQPNARGRDVSTLTAEETARLVDELYRLKSEMPTVVVTRSSTPAQDFMAFANLFNRAGIRPTTGFQEAESPDQTELMISLPDINSPPLAATKVAKILENFGFRTRYIQLPRDANPQGTWNLFVGPRALR